jgi:hypothetical protein
MVPIAESKLTDLSHQRQGREKLRCQPALSLEFNTQTQAPPSRTTNYCGALAVVRMATCGWRGAPPAPCVP